MFNWNNPFVLAIILGCVAIGLFYFDQKQKKNEPNSLAYAKVFSLVTGSILIFNYLINNSVATDLEPVSVKSAFTPVTGNVPTSSSLTTGGGMFSNLKIKEGPPTF
jgi:hypothetical protein